MNFSTAKKRRSAVEVNITPLIDIVFILLVFFLITTTFAQNPGIEVDLPKASSSVQKEQDQVVVIALTKEGNLILRDKMLSLETLEDELGSIFSQQKEATVIIQADGKTDHENVVKVMDISRKIGFTKLAIATEAEL
ncbi:MAG: biopolymer transporter ExbD [Myxococcales bacterium]|nr:biopolymer transporter ExbD [Myxococcales bacterium]|tara:strand:+ start:132 stop:542 length:411 start_codon:yes stop_codon:yes gene_type:complete